MHYTDYRAFLADFYQYRKSTRTGFSYRLFARKAGFKAPNYLQLVIQGKRSLTKPSAERVAVALGLKAAEKAYFVALVGRALASSPEEKEEAEKQKLVAIKRLVTKQIPSAQARVLSEWFHLVVRELVLLKDFSPDPEWISAKLHGLISAKQAEESLKLLQEAGFLERSKDGKLVAKDPVIDTGDAFDPARVLQFHQETLAVWRKLLESLSRDERNLGLLNIPIHHSKVPELIRRVNAFQDEIIGWLQDEKNPDQVVQLGTYVIPISRD